MKTNKIFTILLAVFFMILPLESFAHSASAAFGPPTCAGGDGCLPTCLADTGVADPDCLSGCEISGSAGLIPCGRSCDDPDTADWEEDKPCNLCSMILTGQLIIEFLVKIAAVFAVLSIAFGGFLYIFAAGNQGTLEKAKSIIKNVLLGFIIILIAWAIVDSILAAAGYIDPISGEWYMMNC